MRAARSTHSLVGTALLLALASLSGGCAARVMAQGSTYTVADTPAPVQAPYGAPSQPVPARVIVAAPPLAPAVAASGAVEAPQQPFTPQDSPLLGMHRPGPQGRGPAPIDPLLAPKPARPRTVYVYSGYPAPYGHYGYPYYGYGYRTYGYGYGYRPRGFGAGVALGLGLGLTHHHRHHGHFHGHRHR